MRVRLTILFVLLAVASAAAQGCATTAGARRRARQDVEAVLDQALEMMDAERVRVGHTLYRNDCSGFVDAVFDASGIELVDPGIEAVSGTEAIYRGLQRRGRILRGRTARPGDLAFFHNTWDRNGNKLRDDRFSHVALVERVGPDGAVGLVHFASGKVKRDVMNLRRPGVARDPLTGETVNSYLRRGGGRILSGQLFFRFGRPLPR